MTAKASCTALTSSGKHFTSMKTCFLLRPPPEVRVPRTRVRPPGRGWASPEYKNSACAIGLAPLGPVGIDPTPSHWVGVHRFGLMCAAIHRSISPNVIRGSLLMARSPAPSMMVKLRPALVMRKPSRRSERETRSAWVVCGHHRFPFAPLSRAPGPSCSSASMNRSRRCCRRNRRSASRTPAPPRTATDAAFTAYRRGTWCSPIIACASRSLRGSPS